MTSKPTAMFGTTTWLVAALVTVALTGLPAVAAADYIDCSPATCTVPVLGPGHHVDGETR